MTPTKRQRTLSSRHVVLGLLAERSGYGYDLRSRINERLAFLELAESSIWLVLDRLEKDGLIEGMGARGGRSAPPREMFAVTERGRDEFRRWMNGSSPRSLLREVLHAKLVLSEPADLDSLIAQVVEQEQQCLADLAELPQWPTAELARRDTPWEQVGAMLVDDGLALRLHATIEWLQRVRAVLEKRAGDSAAPADMRSRP